MSVHLILYFHLHNCDSLYHSSHSTAVSRTRSKGVSEIKTSQGVTACLVIEAKAKMLPFGFEMKIIFYALMFWWEKTKLSRVRRRN